MSTLGADFDDFRVLPASGVVFFWHGRGVCAGCFILGLTPFLFRFSLSRVKMGLLGGLRAFMALSWTI
jgi:hypothetical protein